MILALAAFAALPLQDQGHAITVAEKKAIVAKMEGELRDPASAVYKWPRAKNGIYCFWLNSKNAYGGFTGFKPVSVFLSAQPGQPVDVVYMPIDDVTAAKTCRDGGYSMPS
jgi:hypothetical protein